MGTVVIIIIIENRKSSSASGVLELQAKLSTFFFEILYVKYIMILIDSQSRRKPHKNYLNIIWKVEIRSKAHKIFEFIQNSTNLLFIFKFQENGINLEIIKSVFLWSCVDKCGLGEIPHTIHLSLEYFWLWEFSQRDRYFKSCLNMAAISHTS